MRFATLLPLAGLLAMASPALATEVTCGQVASADPGSGFLQLMDGSRYHVSYPTLLKGLGPGDAVRVTQNDNGTVGITDDNRFASPQDGGPGSCLAP